MFFLISKIGGTVLPNMTGTGLKCYPKKFINHNNPLIVSVVYEKLKNPIALYPRPRVLKKNAGSQI